MLFIVLCGRKQMDKHSLWEVLFEQLEVEDIHGQLIQKLLMQRGLLNEASATSETWSTMAISSEASHVVPHLVLDLYANLLSAANRQEDFEKFRAFAVFRDTATGSCSKILNALLQLKPQETEKEKEKQAKKARKALKAKLKEGKVEAAVPVEKPVRQLIAAVRGAARRIMEPSLENFNDTEHAGMPC